jgi:hypothetical protein
MRGKKMKLVVTTIMFLALFPLHSQFNNIWEYKKAILNDKDRLENHFKKNWQTIQLPQNLATLPEDRASDLYWIRNRFSLENFDPKSPLSYRLGIILDCEKIWLNGIELKNSLDCDSSKPQAYDKIRILDLPQNLLSYKGENEILILVKRYFPNEIGIVQDRLDLGESSSIYKDFYYEEGIRLSFLVIYLTVASYFLFLYIRRTQEPEYLFFAVFAINLVAYQFLRCQSKYGIDVQFWILKKMEYLVLPSFIPLMAHFIRNFLKHKYSLSMKVLDILSLLCFFIVLGNSEILFLDQVNRFIIQPIWVFYFINSMYYLIENTLKRNLNAILILIGIICIVGSAIIDIISARMVWNIPRISGYMFIGNILFQAFILANRFVQVYKEVEDLNTNLEIKVLDRTISLENSLSEIQKLKTSQDGDYFLTSLLLKPLHRNQKSKSSIQTEILTIQKKKFEFKNKIHEIGGDLTLTEVIELRDEKYILFLNSDSMGKSIQGAGGALVLGVILESILARMKNQSYRNRYPERWLKDAFLDIQKAFETFDGSMFVSLVLGLIHSDTGFIYYFNAEHPNLILYRDQKASFITSKSPLYLRKMGIKENENNFSIETFALLPQDQIFIGTDGKDDVYIKDNLGNKYMNEDEALILRKIESCNGDLVEIYESIHSNSEMSDDFSLLKIQNIKKNLPIRPQPIQFNSHYKIAKSYIIKNLFSSAQKELEIANKMNPDSKQINFLLGKISLIQKNFQDAILYFERANKNDPENLEIIYLQAVSFKKSNSIKEAIDSAERIRLRAPEKEEIKKFLQSLYNTNYQIPSFELEEDWRQSAA